MNIARLSVKPSSAAATKAQAGTAIQAREAGPPLGAARDPPGDECGGGEQADRAAPGHERERNHARVVGEPRQRAERPEQGRGDDDDGKARNGSAVGRHRFHGRAVAGRRQVGRAGTRRRPRVPAPCGTGVLVVALLRLGRGGERLRSRRLVPGATEADRGERHADLAEDLDRDEEAGEQEQDAEELAELEPFGHPEPAERVAERRNERTDGDQDGRRDAAVEPALDERPGGAGQRGDEVDHDRERGDQQVEQELVAGLVRVERVGEDAPLGHEHVGREDRAEDQREGAGDVEERGQQAELRPGTGSRPARPSPGPPRSPARAASSSPSGRGSARSHRRRPTAARIGQRSLAKYVSTATARASRPAAMKYSSGSEPAPA